MQSVCSVVHSVQYAKMENYETQPCRKPSWSHSKHGASGPQGCSLNTECLETSFLWQNRCWTFLHRSLCQMSRRSPLSGCRCTAWRRAPRTPWRCWLPPACTWKCARFVSVWESHPPAPWTTPSFLFVGQSYIPPRHLTHLWPGLNQCICSILQSGRSQLWNYIFKKNIHTQMQFICLVVDLHQIQPVIN